MAISFGSAGASDDGTTQLILPYPASIASGDLLIICIANKYPTNGPTKPTGWDNPSNFQQQGGQGSSGIDSGQVYCTVFLKVADGTESGNLTVDITSGNTAIGRMFRYTKASNKAWEYALANGSDNTAGTSWSVTAATNPGITTGDLVVVASAQNGDSAGSHTSEVVSATGVTFGGATERQDSGTTMGQDSFLVVSEHPAISGTSSAAPVFTMTGATSTINCPAGASVFVRLREVDPPAGDDPAPPRGIWLGDWM